MASPPDIHHLLKQYWGFDAFRPMQEDIIRSVIDGHNTLALLPTGGGKSLCYQLPALALPGKTLVITPLIALMQDQVQSLLQRGIPAAAIHSGLRRQVMGRSESRDYDPTVHDPASIIIDNWVHGPTKVLFIAPERIQTPIFWERLKRVKLSLLAVDEAHCISQWGFDFRPSYFDIVKVKDLHPKVPIIALTATATDMVVQDIREKLGIEQSNFFRKSFRRENLSISVMQRKDKEAGLLYLVERLHGSGIIYQRNRAQTQEVAKFLASNGHSVHFYHGGLTHEERTQRQEQWMTGKIRIMVCTNAFGMGIDKPDVRFVLHLDVPPSIEEYYQEIGRAGRDGAKSYVVAMLNGGDYEKAVYNFESSYSSMADIASVYQKLHINYQIPVGSGEGEQHLFDFVAFIKRYGFAARPVWNILDMLEKEGFIQLSEAVKTPSMAQMLVTGTALNEMLRDQGPRLRIAQQMLRYFEGLFADLSKIDEEVLAKKMDISELQVRNELRQLHREGIIRYQPAKEGAYVTFLQPRLGKAQFAIDERAYAQRKERAGKRLAEMMAFFKREGCRQQFILDYFGEESGPCGRCDICLGRKKADSSYADAQRHLAEYLPGQEITLDAYVNLWPHNRRAGIAEAVRRMIEEGQLELREGMLRFSG